MWQIFGAVQLEKVQCWTAPRVFQTYPNILISNKTPGHSLLGKTPKVTMTWSHTWSYKPRVFPCGKWVVEVGEDLWQNRRNCNWKLEDLPLDLQPRNEKLFKFTALLPLPWCLSKTTQLNGAVKTGNLWGCRHQFSRHYNLSDEKTPRLSWSWDVTFFSKPLGGWSWKFHQTLPSRHWSRTIKPSKTCRIESLLGQRDLPKRKCQSILDDLLDVLGLGLVGP